MRSEDGEARFLWQDAAGVFFYTPEYPVGYGTDGGWSYGFSDGNGYGAGWGHGYGDGDGDGNVSDFGDGIFFHHRPHGCGFGYNNGDSNGPENWT